MTTSIFHGVENYFPRLWGMGISDTILYLYTEAQTTKSADKESVHGH